MREMGNPARQIATTLSPWANSPPFGCARLRIKARLVQQQASRLHKTYQMVASIACIGVLARAWSQTTPR
jgi:hypothetical protein